jgi:hypothetical protein
MPSGPVAWRSGLYCRALRRASRWLTSRLQATGVAFAPWQLKEAVRTSKSESLAQKSGTTLRDKCLADPPPSSPSPSLHAHNTQHRDSVNKQSHSVCNKSPQGIFHFVRVNGHGKLIRFKMPSVVEQQLQVPEPMTANSESIATQQPVRSPPLLVRAVSCKLVCS